MTINPIRIKGNWDEGYVLDRHIIKSSIIGIDGFGNSIYDTQRTELGELIYQIKYKKKYDKIEDAMKLIAPFIKQWESIQDVQSILAVPYSQKREWQPVEEIAKRIADILPKAIFCENILLKTTNEQAKNLNLNSKNHLHGTIIQTKPAIKRHSILLVDDLYSTGTTLKECVEVLRNDRNIDQIYVLVMTKTKEMR